MDPVTLQLLLSAIGAAGSVAGGYFGGEQGGNSKQNQQIIDELLMGLKGSGQYKDLFGSSYEDFQKGYVDPAKSLFKNQIAPDIQQQYIASGQHRGSGVEDQLTRAGVDLDMMLNQQYGQFRNQGQDRMQSVLNMILNQGGRDPLSTGQKFAQAAGGYFSSPGFSESIKGVSNAYNQRKGFQ